MEYRGEEFPYTTCEWQCEETAEHFSPVWGEDFALQQVYIQYAMKHHQPLPYQIERLKYRTGLTDKVLSELTGIPEEDIKAYTAGETGTMPANYDYSYLHAICSASTEHYADYLCKTKGVDFVKQPLRNFYLGNLVGEPSRKFHGDSGVFADCEQGKKTGFGERSDAKLDAALVYIVKMTVEPLSVKDLNDILFFSDFISYVRNGVSVSGFQYLWEDGFKCDVPLCAELLPDDIMVVKGGIVCLQAQLPIPNLDIIFADAIDLAMHMPEAIKGEVRNVCKAMAYISFDEAITENCFVFARSANPKTLELEWNG
jgi:hypothetical protein